MMPRKSLLEHAVQGTKPHYATGEKVLSPLVGGRPKYPKGISKEARKVFKTLCGLLAERRQLTEADGEALRLYCTAHDRHQRAVAALAAEGEVKVYFRLDSNGVSRPQEKINIWAGVAERAEKFMLATLVQLGLTPIARDKVKQTKVAEPAAELIPGSLAWYNTQPRSSTPAIVPLSQEEEEDDARNAS